NDFGTNLNLRDDETFDRTFGLSLFAFPFGGRFYSGRSLLSISSNGFVSLGGSNGPGCCNGTVPGFLSGVARIPPPATNLVPSGGTFLNSFFGPDGLTFDRLVITWDSRFFHHGGLATAQLQLFSNGTIVMSYRCVDFMGAMPDEVLVGITPGGGAQDPGGTDL